jgi:hypothetical protein
MSASTAEKVSDLGKRLRTLQAEVEVLEAERNLIELELARHFPQEEGVFTTPVLGTDLIVECKRTERWVWDKSHLQKLFGSSLPSYVKQSLTVDRREYKRLPSEERALIEPALTRKLDKPKISVRMMRMDDV